MTGAPALDETDQLRLIAATHGVFLRGEALAHGIDDKTLRRSLRAEVITRVRHGSYTFTDDWCRLSADQRHVVLGRAVMRRVGGVALSHTTAALAHGMDTWDVDLSAAHVTRVDAGAGRTERDLVHHEGFTDARDLTTVLGVLSTRPARAALETAILAGTERGLVTASSGLRRGLFTRDDLAREHDLMARWPRARPLHLVTRLADGALESVGEVRAAYLFWRLGLPRPVPQLEVYDAGGRLIGRVDFAWPDQKLIVEFDGKEKYLRLVRPGEGAADVVVREKRREDALREAGWTVIRLSWGDLHHPSATGVRLRRHLG